MAFYVTCVFAELCLGLIMIAIMGHWQQYFHSNLKIVQLFDPVHVGKQFSFKMHEMNNNLSSGRMQQNMFILFLSTASHFPFAINSDKCELNEETCLWIHQHYTPHAVAWPSPQQILQTFCIQMAPCFTTPSQDEKNFQAQMPFVVVLISKFSVHCICGGSNFLNTKTCRF